MKSLVILISGRGSNMQAIVDAALPVDVRAIVSDRPAAAGLGIARSRGIDTAVVDHQEYLSREAFDAELAATIDRRNPDFVILAGFMRVLTEAFVEHYRGRLINIHPSLLPVFPGLHTHERALQAGVRIHGCTVHFVTAEVDHGPIIIQAAVPVLSDDTPETLAARVLRREHEIYPLAIRWLIEGRARLTAEGKVKVDGVADADESLIWPKVSTCCEH